MPWGRSGLGSFELMRYPIVPSVHMLARVARPWFLVLTAGPYIEIGIEASRGGSQQSELPTPERRFPDALGVMGELGVLYTLGKAGAEITVRYTSLSYETPSTTDASSLGLFISVHYFFL